MSDTPRTDAAQWGTGKVTTDFARQLERELNAANERISRLIKAGDAIVENGSVSERLANEWNNASE